MIQTIQMQVSPEVASDMFKIKIAAANKASIRVNEINDLRITKRSIDARSSNIKINLEVLIASKTSISLPEPELIFDKKNVQNAPEVHVIGAGPAGLFAALRLIERGLKPIIFERGKDVSSRKKDVALLNRNETFNAESNYCYGEGGAGTFSDGKLYTRSKKKGDNQRILELLVIHGAQSSILIDSHPHIGSDKLPEIIKQMRATILECGGEIHFNSRVSDFKIKQNKITHIRCNDILIETRKVILASGHSARDIYYMLHHAGVELEAKACAMGVRAEHPQELVDKIQYHGNTSPLLPAASYSLVHQAKERGVYSFCMCPGGIIVPSATENNQLVVNGMSSSQRNSPFANSGIAVELRIEDFSDYKEHGILAGLKFQEHLERMAYQNGGINQVAPAQTITDFVARKISQDLPECSYLPGIVSSPMHFWLPDHISTRLQEAFKAFDRKMRGYITREAVIVGVESRTSSPIRIPRDSESLQHIRITNLFPCGEGAGYAGGIVSSAIDGMNCADKVS